MDNKKKSTVVDVVPVNMMMVPSDWFDYSMNFNEGQIVASNSQRVFIDTEKLVKTVFVEEGQEVKKGDPILEYDMTVVELELAQKENRVKIAEQDIKMAKKELENIRRYKPSEDAPTMPEYDFPDYDFEEPEMPEMPDMSEFPDMEDPAALIPPPTGVVSDVVGADFAPTEGSGTPEAPYIVNCTQEAEISKEFMVRVVGEKKCVEVCVFDEELQYLYKWIIVPTETNYILNELESWKVSDGITIDEMGQASIDTSVKLYGKLSFTNPTSERYKAAVPDEFNITDLQPTPEEDELDIPDYPEYDPDDYYIDPNSNDYVYSREAIKNLITEQESEIKQLEIALKTANFELETAKKRKRDGKLYAEIDGYVKKIGKASGEEDTEEELSEEDLYSEPSPDDKAFAVIEGEGGTEVLCTVSEMNLESVAIGSHIDVHSWNSNAYGTAEVTKLEDEPLAYQGMGWGENPNSSTYLIHAKMIDGADQFSIYDWVEVTMDSSQKADKKESNSVYIPLHYVHQEGGDYYIMKADENGLLKKQYIKVGQVMEDRYIEVKGGLNSDDKICFPFGKDVKEGVKTRETSTALMPENVDFYY